MGFCPQKYWVKDEEAPTCGYCGEEFTLTNRRHHCRLCGDIFHAGKCAQKAGSLEVWVCYYCHSYHTVHKEKLQNGKYYMYHFRMLLVFISRDGLGGAGSLFSCDHTSVSACSHICNYCCS